MTCEIADKPGSRIYETPSEDERPTSKEHRRMSEPRYILIASVVGGALLVVAAPRLTRVRLFLPLSRAPFGRALALIAEEAFAVILLSVGLRGLLGDSSPFASVLDAVKAFAFITFGMSAIGGWVGEVIHGVQHRDDVGET